MRELETQNVHYQLHLYDKKEIEKGFKVWDQIGKDMSLVYKTIVLHHLSDNYVAIIPIHKHIDLKKAARAFNVKKLELLPLSDLLKTTGYVRGGCSAVGMKKKFPSLIDQHAKTMDTFIVSAGKVGYQMEVSPLEFAQVIQAQFTDLCLEE